MGTNTSKKRKFNAVDAVIIFLIIAVIAAAAVLFVVKGTGDDSSEKIGIEYVVEFRQIREEFGDNIKVGAIVSDAVAKYQLGEVVAVNVENATYNGNNMNTGELVVVDYPERINVQMTIRTSAEIQDDGMYYIDGGFRISVGSVVYVRMPDYTGTSYCVEIKETEADA